MNLDKNIRLLAARARLAKVPGTDVTDRVILQLRADKPELVYALERPFMWMAGLSSAIAVSVVVLALLFSLGGATDPLNEVVETVSWATQQ